MLHSEFAVMTRQRLAELEEPPAEARFRRRLGVIAAVRELWGAKPLVRSLAERELRSRYKQAVLGFSWAILTPLALMTVFTLFFNRIAKVNTGGSPYPVFAYLGLIPWTFFSTSVAQGGVSLLTNRSLLNKIYCPREVFPTASVVVAALDSCVAVVGLVVLMAVFRVAPSPTVIWVPLLLAVQVAFALGVACLLSATILYFRDLRHVLPLILQVGLFTTPVAYGMDVVPGSLRFPYAAVNPLAPVIDGYRRTILLGQAPDFGLLAAGALTSLVVLIGGYLVFKKLETGFADIA